MMFCSMFGAIKFGGECFVAGAISAIAVLFAISMMAGRRKQ